MNRQFVSQMFHEITEPCSWLRWEPVSTPGKQKEMTKLAEQLRRTPGFERQLLTLGSLNLSSNTALVKASIDWLKIRPKINFVKTKSLIDTEAALLVENALFGDWPDFDISIGVSLSLMV